MNKLIVVAGLKGGAGKSITSGMLLPIHGNGKPVYVYEIDSSNRTILPKSKHVNFKTFTVNEANNALTDIDFKLLSQKDGLHIVDIGGGTDTRNVLEQIGRSDLNNLTYVLPMNDDFDQIDNIKETISIINTNDDHPKIHLLLNRVHDMDEKAIKKQFPGLFGSKKYGIKSRINEIEGDICSIKFVPNTSILGIVKNLYQRSLLDSYIESLELVNNITEYKSKWVLEGESVFRENMSRYRFAKDIIELVEVLKPLSEIVE